MDQSSPIFFKYCYPLRPPIMPNFIEIGQTSLEKSVKKRYLFGPSRHFLSRKRDYLSRVSQRARGGVGIYRYTPPVATPVVRRRRVAVNNLFVDLFQELQLLLQRLTSVLGVNVQQGLVVQILSQTFHANKSTRLYTTVIRDEAASPPPETLHSRRVRFFVQQYCRVAPLCTPIHAIITIRWAHPTYQCKQ